MPLIIEFETERLFLRQWRASDFEPFAQINADPKVMEFFPTPLDRDRSDGIAKKCMSLIEERGWGFWAVELKESGVFLGFVGLHVPIAELPFSPCVEIGWRLAYEYWGNGFATEAAKESLRVGFELLRLPEIVSFAVVGNIRSRNVMKRIGMHNTSITFEHPSIDEGSSLREHCLYRITQEQWSEYVA